MTTAETMYRATLEELASEGNEKARLVLKLAELPAASPDFDTIKNSVKTALKGANANLIEAIKVNGDRWTRSTDDYIHQAQTKILSAVSALSD